MPAAPVVVFTAAEVEVVKAVADTFVAAVQLDGAAVQRLAAAHGIDAGLVRAFFAQQASDVDTHTQIVDKLRTLVRPEEARSLKLLTGLLSTSAGTLLLAGHLRPFAQLSQRERELVLRSWSNSQFALIRKIFMGMKSLAGLTYFASIDQFQRSVAWDAIRYPGPPRSLLEAAKQPSFAFEFQDPFKLSPDGVLGYDAVVVGSGCGGGVAAAVLSQSGARVLVLEKAKYYRRDEYTLTENKALATLYEGGGTVVAADTGMTILAGSAFGGGSQINWSASFRTPDHVRKEWAEEHKLPVFASKRYDDALDAICSRLGVHADGVQHNPANGKILQGCQKLGYHVDVIPRNAPGEHDCGWCTWGCTRGLKQGMQETFLQDAARAGTHFMTGAHVLRVLHKNGKATGVVAEFTDASGRVRRFEVCAKVVVVSAGTLNTPLLLLRSGLKNRNIGKHLRLHPVTVVRGTFPDDIKPWDGCNMSAVSRQVANRNGKHYGALIETPIIHPGLYGAALPWRAAAEYKEMALGFKNQAFFIVLCRDTGSGTVGLDGDGHLLVNYSLNQFDTESLMEGILASVKIMIAAGATEVQAGNPALDAFRPTSTDLNDPAAAQYLAAVRAAGLPAHKAPLFCAHQMGSCRLGNDRGAASVLNPDGETWEVRDLFVADASTFPTPSGVNPMITTEATACVIAQNAVARVRAAASSSPSSVAVSAARL